MNLLKRALLTLVLASMTISALASTASASRSLSLSPAGPFTATSQGLVSFPVPGVYTLTCLLTLQGTLSRAIAKRSGSTLGNITSATSTQGANSTCNEFPVGSGVRPTVNYTGFPWPITYLTFLGTLPNITGVLFHITPIERTINIPALGLSCRNRGTLAALLAFTGAAGTPRTSGLLRLLPNRIPTVSGGGCPASEGLEGAFNFVPRSTLILIN